MLTVVFNVEGEEVVVVGFEVVRVVDLEVHDDVDEALLLRFCDVIVAVVAEV